ncbi:hypothetical protein [Devosia riboflavina]|uniref:hypothetical protein n=1 Tax=Devosia riboflavina TaxID=46914 RepID=UPI00068D6A88|nr:hypothetical protein [Devosia riboflavina]
MKIGYSLLLGEYVPADQARYGDMTGFQIVCPCCKDPLIKVERPTPKDVTEFFSHYASKPGMADCEMRVASITQEDRTRTDSASRGQNLKVFLSVYRDAMSLEFANDDSPWNEYREMYGVRWFADFLASYLKSDEWIGEKREELLDWGLEPIDAHRIASETGLAISYRRKVAKDITDHLTAPYAEKNRRFSAEFAIRTLVSFRWFLRRHGDPEENIDFSLAKILTDDREAFDIWLDEVKSEDPEQERHFLRLTHLGMTFLLRSIMGMPVLDMLRNHRAGKRPLEGITALDHLHVRGDIDLSLPHDPAWVAQGTRP